MTDWLSSLLGGLLIQVFLVGAVVVTMAMVLRGEYLLAAGMLIPLALAGYLVSRDAGLL